MGAIKVSSSLLRGTHALIREKRFDALLIWERETERTELYCCKLMITNYGNIFPMCALIDGSFDGMFGKLLKQRYALFLQGRARNNDQIMYDLDGY